MEKNHDRQRKIFGPISLVVLAFAFLGIWISFFISGGDKKLKVTFFDVGQGDSSYVEFPDGKSALIDGGPDKKVLERLGQKMPFYKRNIDIVFITHPHADHIAGLVHVIKRYDVGRVVMTKAVHTSPEYQELLTIIRDKKIPVTQGLRGAEFDFSNEVKIKTLYPQSVAGVENLNDTSQVLLLESGQTKFLFMGDLEKDSSGNLLSLEPSLRVDTVKVPHHGSRDSFNENIYKNLQPKYAVISVGENKYGHPYGELLNFLDHASIKYFRTDKNGSVSMSSDGKNLDVSK